MVQNYFCKLLNLWRKLLRLRKRLARGVVIVNSIHRYSMSILKKVRQLVLYSIW